MGGFDTKDQIHIEGGVIHIHGKEERETDEEEQFLLWHRRIYRSFFYNKCREIIL